MAFNVLTAPLFDYLFILRKKVWLLFLILFLTVGLTALTTFRQTPVYEATCKIRYKKGSPASYLASGSSLFFMNPYYDDVSFETERHVIESKMTAEGVVKTLGLASPRDPSSWKRWIGRVQGALSVGKLKDTRIYLITARATDPDLAQALANTAAAVYIDFSLKEKQESADRLLAVLTEQINELKIKIQQSEMAKIDYVTKTREVPESGDQAAAVHDNQLGVSRSVSLLDDLRATMVKEEIEREHLLNNYKEKHPRVREIERQISVLKEKIADENERIIEAHRAAIEYGILEKEARADQEQYQILIKKLKDLNLSDSGIESGIEIIERAERPGAPVAPRKTRNLVLSAVLGLFLGLGAVFILEYFDPTLQTPEEVKNYLGLPVLATIPRMNPPKEMGEEEARKYTLLIGDRSPASQHSEMFKNLRTNVRFSDPEAGSIALLVTSSAPREGKSTISANLAITFAHAGTRTILVDADMRRPALHKAFDLDNSVGLSSFLKSEVSLEEVIRPTSIKDLFVVPSGPIPPNPSELLESPRMPEFIARLRETAARIVFDSPPGGALTDSTIIAGLVDGVILVCYSGHINKKFVLQTKQQLEKSGARIYGIVLNYIDLKLRSYYYFYHGMYKYGYNG